MRRRRSLVLLVAGLGAAVSGCGEVSFIVLRVRADLVIPDQTDRLEIQILPRGGREPLKAWGIDLAADHPFPFDVGVEPSDDTPRALEAFVTATLGGATVASSRSEFSWYRDAATRVLLPPLEPPP